MPGAFVRACACVRAYARACVRAQVLQTRIAREATVLFIDIKGFTAGCAQMTVAQVPSPAATGPSRMHRPCALEMWRDDPGRGDAGSCAARALPGPAPP